jgi:hypothetical protein
VKPTVHVPHLTPGENLHIGSGFRPVCLQLFVSTCPLTIVTWVSRGSRTSCSSSDSRLQLPVNEAGYVTASKASSQLPPRRH